MRKIKILFIVVLLFSCGKKREVEIPDNILSKEKMIAVLVDAHILEASMNLSLTPSKVAADTNVNRYNILKHNNISKIQYEESFKFYIDHPDLLNELYEGVLIELSKKQAEEVNKQ